jgi:hypothetical protein
VWIARVPGAKAPDISARGGEISIDAGGVRDDRRMIPVTFDAAWTAELDGRTIPVDSYRGAFLSVAIPAGSRRLLLRYNPLEVRLALMLSSLGLLSVLACFAAEPISDRPRGDRKSGSRSWRAAPHRVRIGFTTSGWSPNRLPTEGRDADGPLHV